MSANCRACASSKSWRASRSGRSSPPSRRSRAKNRPEQMPLGPPPRRPSPKPASRRVSPKARPVSRTPEAEPFLPVQERLQKTIARAGVTSRRKAEDLILAGRVTVNGRVVNQLGSKADPARDKIVVRGKPIHPHGPRVYLLLNKPVGYISTVS